MSRRAVGPKVEARLTPGQVAVVDNYAAKRRLPSRADAIRQLLDSGFRVADAQGVDLADRAREWVKVSRTVREGNDLRAVYQLLGSAQVLMAALADVVDPETDSS